jgi:hypothetical protein
LLPPWSPSASPPTPVAKGEGAVAGTLDGVEIMVGITLEDIDETLTGITPRDYSHFLS